MFACFWELWITQAASKVQKQIRSLRKHSCLFSKEADPWDGLVSWGDVCFCRLTPKTHIENPWKSKGTYNILQHRSVQCKCWRFMFHVQILKAWLQGMNSEAHRKFRALMITLTRYRYILPVNAYMFWSYQEASFWRRIAPRDLYMICFSMFLIIIFYHTWCWCLVALVKLAQHPSWVFTSWRSLTDTEAWCLRGWPLIMATKIMQKKPQPWTSSTFLIIVRNIFSAGNLR